MVVCESVPTRVSGYAAAWPFFLHKNYASQVFQVDLMDDSGIGWNNRQITQSSLSPPQERVALAVAMELEIGIQLESLGRTEFINLHRVVNDQFGRL